MNKDIKFNEITCLAHALRLLFKVGEMNMYEVRIQRISKE